MNFEPIIGLEVHVELKTKSKMFCGCPADYFGHEPNTHTCPVCLGLPGALPVPNRKAIEWCLKLGLALDCQVNENSFFERKNYFYPDLPKGYQISQYSKPFCVGGFLKIKNGENEKTIRINRVHMEEDTGKLLHSEQIPNYKGPQGVSLVDFNRSGVPLVEIVTEPDFANIEEVTEYLKKLQLLIRYLDVSDADMEEGSMRIEPTINLRIKNQESSDKDNEQVYYTPLVEIKNINSFRFVKQALEYEIKRQAEEFEKTHEEKKAGNKTTAGFNEAKRMTVPQRSKEEANDYRYFPEPDIPPMVFDQLTIDNLKSEIPELSDKKVERYQREWQVRERDAQIIVSDRETAEFFEAAVGRAIKLNFPLTSLPSIVVNKRVNISGTTPEAFVDELKKEAEKPKVDDAQLKEICIKIIDGNPKAVLDYKSGKGQSFQYLAGLVMKEIKGRAEATTVASILTDLLES